MTLNDNLYKIISSDTSERSFRLELIPDCTIYKAHFPSKPVTPGVCVIQIASELLSLLMNKELALTTVSNAKFLSVINPLETKNITCTFRKISEGSDNSINVSATITEKDTVFSKLSLIYRHK
ncbi:MAG: beta-hydroxyacyl-ACP dehydratase [Muribaculaceae bacterium]|nr:beta-hydroxyacyl-ACP dehydratase [Muribaculaceae bacterium]